MVAIGVLGVAISFYAARSGVSDSQVLFWTGLVAIVAPIAYRLAGSSATRGERIGLCVLLVVALYLMKVLYSPVAFTFSDEYVHAANAERALLTGHLFNENLIISVTEYYPGLASATSAVASLTGLGFFPAGLLVIGAARLVLALALFLLLERLTGSARVAGLGVLIYAGNPNFLFWSAQYAYESLALPLLIALLYLVAGRRFASRQELLIALILVPAITVTHHLTAYAMTTVLVVVALAALVRREERARWTLLLAAYAAVVTVGWLVLVASSTRAYLQPVFQGAFESMRDVIGGAGDEAAGRSLFESSEGVVAPVAERIVALAAVGIPFALLPIGLVALARRERPDALVTVLRIAAVGVFAALLLRFAPGAWETGSRASEFLYIGLALVAGVGAERLLEHRWSRDAALVTAGLAASIIVAGGVIAGWAPALRLPQPFEVRVEGRTIEPAGVEVARWSRQLGRTAVISDVSNARLLEIYALHRAFDSEYPSISAILEEPAFPPWQPETLRELGARYVLIDERRAAWDNMAGYFFTPPGVDPDDPDRYFPPEQYEKFERLGADRLVDGGFLSLYDIDRAILESLCDALSSQPSSASPPWRRARSCSRRPRRCGSLPAWRSPSRCRASPISGRWPRRSPTSRHSSC